jgi:hypothetical protein
MRNRSQRPRVFVFSSVVMRRDAFRAMVSRFDRAAGRSVRSIAESIARSIASIATSIDRGLLDRERGAIGSH